MTQWTVHGTRRIYESEWMSVDLDDDDHVLLMWRHRFTTDAWGWEIPAGRCEEGETAEVTALRETEEETGYRPGRIEPLVTLNPLNGISSHVTHVFVGSQAVRTGEPDPAEAAKVEWVPLSEIPALIRKGLIPRGITLAAPATCLTLRTTWSGPPSRPLPAG